MEANEQAKGTNWYAEYGWVVEVSDDVILR